MSRHTVLSYRDAIALFLRFIAAERHRSVISLDIADLGPATVIAFLDHLEKQRGNCPATRNARLAAIHAFARYVAAHAPEHMATCQSLLAVPFKRSTTRVVEYLEGAEFRAMLEAVDPKSRQGRRDRALLLTFLNTGARVQEILDLRPTDIQLDRPLRIRLFGKGRKERLCPLWSQTADALRAVVTDATLGDQSTEKLFRNRRGEPLTRFGVGHILKAYARRAQASTPSISRKRVHPHTMRHTAAVHLLQAGVDLVSISHWLGHASVETTNRYATIDLETKRKAVEKAGPIGDAAPRVAKWRSDASILDWLEAL